MILVFSHVRLYSLMSVVSTNQLKRQGGKVDRSPVVMVMVMVEVSALVRVLIYLMGSFGPVPPVNLYVSGYILGPSPVPPNYLTGSFGPVPHRRWPSGGPIITNLLPIHIWL